MSEWLLHSSITILVTTVIQKICTTVCSGSTRKTGIDTVKYLSIIVLPNYWESHNYIY